MVGGFSWIEFGGLVAGVQIPKSTAYLTAKELFTYLLGVCLLLLMGSALLSLFWSGKLTKPIERLSDVTERVGRGDFDIHVEPPSRDEIGALAHSINHMASELKTRETALREAHALLIHSEKMAAFGQLGVGIAHEVKNPLAGILGYAQLSLRKLEEGNQLYNNLKVIGRIAGHILCWKEKYEQRVGYWLGREFWGRGIASAALAEFLKEVKTRPLYAHVANHNAASRRVLEKCGFVLLDEGTRMSVFKTA